MPTDSYYESFWRAIGFPFPDPAAAAVEQDGQSREMEEGAAIKVADNNSDIHETLNFLNFLITEYDKLFEERNMDAKTEVLVIFYLEEVIHDTIKNIEQQAKEFRQHSAKELLSDDINQRISDIKGIIPKPSTKNIPRYIKNFSEPEVFKVICILKDMQKKLIDQSALAQENNSKEAKQQKEVSRKALATFLTIMNKVINNASEIHLSCYVDKKINTLIKLLSELKKSADHASNIALNFVITPTLNLIKEVLYNRYWNVSDKETNHFLDAIKQLSSYENEQRGQPNPEKIHPFIEAISGIDLIAGELADLLSSEEAYKLKNEIHTACHSFINLQLPIEELSDESIANNKMTKQEISREASDLLKKINKSPITLELDKYENKKNHEMLNEIIEQIEQIEKIEKTKEIKEIKKLNGKNRKNKKEKKSSPHTSAPHTNEALNFMIECLEFKTFLDRIDSLFAQNLKNSGVRRNITEIKKALESFRQEKIEQLHGVQKGKHPDDQKDDDDPEIRNKAKSEAQKASIDQKMTRIFESTIKEVIKLISDAVNLEKEFGKKSYSEEFINGFSSLCPPHSEIDRIAIFQEANKKLVQPKEDEDNAPIDPSKLLVKDHKRDEQAPGQDINPKKKIDNEIKLLKAELNKRIDNIEKLENLRDSYIKLHAIIFFGEKVESDQITALSNEIEQLRGSLLETQLAFNLKSIELDSLEAPARQAAQALEEETERLAEKARLAADIERSMNEARQEEIRERERSSRRKTLKPDANLLLNELNTQLAYLTAFSNSRNANFDQKRQIPKIQTMLESVQRTLMEDFKALNIEADKILNQTIEEPNFLYHKIEALDASLSHIYNFFSANEDLMSEPNKRVLGLLNVRNGTIKSELGNLRPPLAVKEQSSETSPSRSNLPPVKSLNHDPDVEMGIAVAAATQGLGFHKKLGAVTGTHREKSRELQTEGGLLGRVLENTF
jgi:hypothetical protein